MPSYSEFPRGVELEDFVAGHLVSRGVYVETSVTKRDPIDILEIDVVWTDYSKIPIERNPIEVKSGKWSLGDLFKFYGWTKYLRLPPGQYICHRLPDRITSEALLRLFKRLGIELIHVAESEEVEERLGKLGLPNPAYEWLPTIWRYSFKVQRKLYRSLSVSVDRKHCPETAKKAKAYENLINDAVFFEEDPRSRVEALFSAHQQHRKLALTAANEIQGLAVDFDHPQKCKVFEEGLYHGKHLPVQACLTLGHRGRLSVLKAAVDYYVARESGTLPKKKTKFWGIEFDEGDAQLYIGFKKAVDRLARAKSFLLFPTFWQIFIFGWGGFILKDREEEEYLALEKETGVHIDEIPIALSAFDELFYAAAPWMNEPLGESRRLLKLTSPVYRGLGAYNRLQRYKKKEYNDMGYSDDTTRRMIKEHNTLVRLLKADHGELLK